MNFCSASEKLMAIPFRLSCVWKLDSIGQRMAAYFEAA